MSVIIMPDTETTRRNREIMRETVAGIKRDQRIRHGEVPGIHTRTFETPLNTNGAAYGKWLKHMKDTYETFEIIDTNRVTSCWTLYTYVTYSIDEDDPGFDEE